MSDLKNRAGEIAKAPWSFASSDITNLIAALLERIADLEGDADRHEFDISHPGDDA